MNSIRKMIMNQINEYPDIKIISFDIFDTLVFRMVKNPEMVYKNMYEKEPGMFPEHIKGDDFREIRVKTAVSVRAESYDKSTDIGEITLNDIYDGFPKGFETDAIKALEIQCEKETVYLNREIYDIACELKRDGKSIVLVSDMYLGKEIISEILEYNGADLCMFDSIYVSCDYKMNKRTGTIYNRFLADYNVKPNEVLHVGDDYIRDVSVPTGLGMRAIHYSFIPEARFAHPALIMEALSFQSISDYHSPRLIAANNNPYSNIEEKCAFEIGALILGPFISQAVEWVLDFADEHEINRIRPLMREGEFLCKLLNNAAQKRKNHYDIRPLYASRLAAFTAAFWKIHSKDLNYMFRSMDLTLEKALEILKIKDAVKGYEEYFKIPVRRLANIQGSNKSVRDDILRIIEQPEMMELIRKRNSQNGEIMLSYLKQMGVDKECLTLDLGWGGYTQNAIDHLLKDYGIDSKLIHLLFVADNRSAENIIDGSDIRGFLGNCGSNLGDITKIHHRFLELVFMGEEGTTIGYTKSDDGVVRPETQEIEYPTKQKRMVRIIQDGMMEYQNVFLSMKLNFDLKGRMQAATLFKPIVRLCFWPLQTEATVLKDFVFDQNFGENKMIKLLPDEAVEKRMGAKDISDFYRNYPTDSVVWYSLLNAYVDARYHVKNLINSNQWRIKETLLSMLTEALDYEDGNGIVVVGAGARGMELVELSYVIGENNKLIGMIDNDIKKHEMVRGGLTIREVRYDFGNPVYLCSLMQKEKCIALKNQIETELKRNVRFICSFKDESNV